MTVDCKNFIATIERASLIITERLKNPLRISFAEDKVTVRCQTRWARSWTSSRQSRWRATR